MTILALALLALQTAAGAPLAFSVTAADKTLTVRVSGPEGGLPAGAFEGGFALNGSSSELPVAGTVTHSGGRWNLSFPARYADLPADWADRFHPETFAYRLRGSVGGQAGSWNGTAAWKDVEFEESGDTASRFLTLGDVRLTEMSLTSSEAVAEVIIVNPFAFDLRIAETAYALSANGSQVGSGSTRGLILRARSRNTLTLPIEIDHGELIGAAGKALVSGGEVRARLRGRLVIRLKGGDIAVPLDLSGNLSDGS